MRPKTVDDEQLYDSLLDAFADLGFEGTSMRQLCRHLGVSHNLINERCGSKEEAWCRAVDHGFACLAAQLAEEIPAGGDPDDEVELLRSAMLRYVEATIARPSLTRIIQQEAIRPGPRFDYMYRRHINPIRAGTDALIVDLQRRGLMKSGDAGSVHFFLTTWGLGGLASVPDGTVGVGGLVAERLKIARLAVDVVVDGLRARG